MTPQGMAKKPRANREERLQTILEAAQGVFIEHGYHNAAMDEIATRAGVSKPIVYQFFPGKRDLYLALLERNVSFLVVALETSLTESAAKSIGGRVTNQQAVHDTIHSYFEFAEKQNSAFRMVYECDLLTDEGVKSVIRRATMAFGQTMAAAIVRCSDLTQEQSKLLSFALIGLARASALHWTKDDTSMSGREAADTVVQLAWQGLNSFPDAQTSAETQTSADKADSE